jgi:hypothetical protein
MAERKPIEVAWPVKGLNEMLSYSQQPEGTTPDCLNVRPFDALGRRLRGGQRSGCSKYVAATVNTPQPIQLLDQLNYALDPSAISIDFTTPIFADLFAYANGQLKTLNPVSWPASFYNDGSNTTQDNELVPIQQSSAGGALRVVAGSGVDAGTGVARSGYADGITPALVLGAAYAVRVGATISASYTAVSSISILLRVNALGGAIGTHQCLWAQLTPTGATTGGVSFNSETAPGGGSQKATVNGNLFGGASRNFTLAGGKTWAQGFTFDVRVNGDQFSVYINDTLIESYTSSTFAGFNQVGFALGQSGAVQSLWDPTNKVTAFYVYRAFAPLLLRSVKLITVSGGNIYTGDRNGVTLASSGTAALSASGYPSSTAAFQKTYFCDGNQTGYKVYDPQTDTVSTWAATQGTMPAGGSGTTYPVTAIDPTNGTITATGAGAALATNSFIQMSGARVSGNNQTYKITGKAGDVLSVTPSPISATVTTGVTVIRAAVSACRFATLYRGRVVLYGLASDPQNWFMSAVGDPLNWDYNPNPAVETQAVAGNNSLAGLLGDRVSCCAPFNDDLMVMGGDHTLWVMRGDPAAGGRIDNLSQQIGISGALAYCIDPAGVMYFFGNGVVWKMIPGSPPEPLSRGRLDRTFGALDLTASTIKMIWDDARHGFHMFIIPQQDHYFWDARTDGFWKDEFPVVVGPNASIFYAANAPQDQALLLGGQDSYIRQLDDTKNDDDGVSIVSRVRFGPIQPGGLYGNTKLVRTTAKLDTSSDPVKLRVYAGNTPQSVITSSTPVWAKDVSVIAPYATPRITGNALLIEFKNSTFTTAWVTGHNYAVGDQVVQAGLPYTCLIAHTSGTFATDLAAADWVLDHFRTWAIEGVSIIAEGAGRTRHGRL